MTKYKLTFLFALLLLITATTAWCQTYIFNYKWNQKKIEQIFDQFIRSQILENKVAYSLALEQFKASNKLILKSPPKLGDQIKLSIDSDHLDLLKLKKYYLHNLGGKYYSEDLYHDEMVINEKLKHYNNTLNWSIGYNYIPYYAISKKEKNSSKDTLYSLFGLNANIEFIKREDGFPLYLFAEATYTQISNANGIAQTVPERRKTFSFNPAISYNVAFGGHFRESQISLYSVFDKSKEYSLDFIPAEDRSYIRETDLYFLGLGIKLHDNDATEKNARTTITMNALYAVFTQDKLIDFSGSTSSSSAVYKISIEPKINFSNELYLSYSFDGTFITNSRKTNYYRNTISVGKSF